MSFVLTSDGLTIDQWQRARPTGSYPRKDLPSHVVMLHSKSDAEALGWAGWYEVTDVARPSNSPTETYLEDTPNNTGVNQWEQVWTHNPAAHDNRLRQDARPAARSRVATDSAQFSTWAQAARDRQALIAGLPDPTNQAEAITQINQMRDELATIYGHLSTLLDRLDDVALVTGAS